MYTMSFAFICYSAYILLLLASFLMLCVPGALVPYYAVLGVIGTAPVLSKSTRARQFVIPAVAIAMFFLVRDHYLGLAIREASYEMQIKAIRDGIIKIDPEQKDHEQK